jgi:hypothetical protein
MKRISLPFMLAGVGIGIAVYLAIRNLASRERVSALHLTTQDLHSPDKSPEELLSNHLTDLNSAHLEELGNLGLDEAAAERLIENRPYRNKLELVSRMVLPQQIYDSIKSKIAIAGASEPIKIATG